MWFLGHFSEKIEFLGVLFYVFRKKFCKYDFWGILVKNRITGCSVQRFYFCVEFHKICLEVYTYEWGNFTWFYSKQIIYWTFQRIPLRYSPFFVELPFIHCTCMLSAWQGSFNYQFENFSLTRPGIEPPASQARIRSERPNHSATELVYF